MLIIFLFLFIVNRQLHSDQDLMLFTVEDYINASLVYCISMTVFVTYKITKMDTIFYVYFIGVKKYE